MNPKLIKRLEVISVMINKKSVFPCKVTALL